MEAKKTIQGRVLASKVEAMNAEVEEGYGTPIFDAMIEEGYRGHHLIGETWVPSTFDSLGGEETH